MNVIVFASRKGGSGKSTLTAHLAAQVHRQSRPILLIDSDPQGSLTLWHKMRGNGEPPLCTATEAVGDLIKTAELWGYEWVFIYSYIYLQALLELGCAPPFALLVSLIGVKCESAYKKGSDAILVQ